MFRTAYLYIRLFYYLIKCRKEIKETPDENADLLIFLAKKAIKYGGKNVRAIGLENIPKENGVLYIANHQSFFDIYGSLAVVGKQLSFMGKKKLEKFFYVGDYIIASGGVLIDRDDVRSQMNLLKDIITLLKTNHNVVIYPEGTRSKDGSLSEFKSGSFRIAQKSKCKIVPITFYDNHDVAKHKTKTIKVKIDKPIEYTELENLSTKEIADKVKAVIQNNLNEGFDDNEAKDVNVDI